ncbi:MAG TPA: RAMP superfamily CRISPR-associated protein [Aggregatilineales bacterium]|nr:RAMP superfamily CRISPR-associated protein [Aggregatilineales bacterium]
MHRQTVNELRLDFSVSTVSPLFIPDRSPIPANVPSNREPSLPSRFVRAIHPASGERSVFIPASIVKGALRRAAESVLLDARVDCCSAEQACSERQVVQHAKDAPAIYRALCPACRLFGSRAMRSHVSVTDSFPQSAYDPPLPRGSLADESLSSVTFYGSLSLRNFERWHVGLLSLLIARINLAEVQMGASRAQGMGCVAIRYLLMTIIYPGLEATAQQQQALRSRLHGVGQLLGAKNPYGYVYPDVADVPDLPETAEFDMGMGVSAVTITAESTDEEPNAAHALIDNVLTNQALTWGSYTRLHRGAAQA